MPVDLDARAFGDYADHCRGRDDRAVREELATHHDASRVDFLNVEGPDLVLQSASVQLLDPGAKTLVAVVRAAGPPGSGWMELDLRVRDRH